MTLPQAGSGARAAEIATDPPAHIVALAPLVDEALDQYLARVPLPENLRDAIRYSTLGGGKRLRPILVMLSCAATGGDHRTAMAPAGAVELIHAFSLVHDDLPAMDDDDLRRGVPTAHVKYGEAMAILAGDAMMSLAFEMLREGIPDPGLEGRLSAELAAGTTAMIAGQVYDTVGGIPPHLSDREALELIHRSKTGALLRASCRMGALCGMWPAVREQHLQAVSDYAEAVGLMFQIVDDLLDVEQTAERLGKRANKDHDAGKRTYPGLLGVEASRAEVDRLRAAALASLEPLGSGAGDLRELCEYLAVRTH